jgi:hypothetical protein
MRAALSTNPTSSRPLAGTACDDGAGLQVLRKDAQQGFPRSSQPLPPVRH